MFSKDEATTERRQAYVAALEHEKAGYIARLEAKQNGLHTGGLDLSVEQLADRIKQVDQVIKSVAVAKKPRANKS